VSWHRVLTATRGVLVGWAALLLLTYLVEQPLLGWTAPLFGVVWIATARLSLHCLVMAGTGWLVGRANRTHAVADVLVFAATLCPWGLLLINVPWLVRLTWDALRDTSYLDAWFTTAASHVFLFGSLIAGGMLSRPPRPILTIAEPLAGQN
jgi:hypothetical protein